jgi:hypothetical protein
MTTLSLIFDGVAKTHQLLRCCNCSGHCGVPEYASFLDNCAPCIWRFLLAIHSSCLLAKASLLNIATATGEQAAAFRRCLLTITTASDPIS